MAYKRSKKAGYQNNFYFSIVEAIKNTSKLPNLSISKQRMQYYIKQLKIDGVIYKLGYATYSVDWDRWQQVKFIEQVKKQGSDGRNIRGHGFHYKIYIPKITNWHKRKDYLDKKKILYKESNATWKGYRIIIKGYKIWLCDNSLVIYAPVNKSFYNWSAEDSKISALSELFDLLRSIESRLNISLKVNGKYAWKVSKQHYGKIKDSMAKLVNKETSKIICRLNGEEWLLFDRSLNVDEQETIHPKDAVVDMDKIIVPFYNGLKEHYKRTGEALTVNSLLNVVQLQQNNLEMLQNQINELLYKSPEKLKPRDNYFG